MRCFSSHLLAVVAPFRKMFHVKPSGESVEGVSEVHMTPGAPRRVSRETTSIDCAGSVLDCSWVLGSWVGRMRRQSEPPHCLPDPAARSANRSRRQCRAKHPQRRTISFLPPHWAVCALWRQRGPTLWLPHDVASGFGPSAGRMTRVDDKLLAVPTELSYDARLSVKVRAPYHAVSRFV